MRLAEIRKQKNLTQSQLGALVGVEQNTIAQYENEKRLPNVKAIEKLCRALDVTPNELLGIDKKGA